MKGLFFRDLILLIILLPLHTALALPASAQEAHDPLSLENNVAVVAAPELMPVALLFQPTGVDVLPSDINGELQMVEPNDVDILLLKDASVNPDEQALIDTYPNAKVLDKSSYRQLVLKDFGDFPQSEAKYWTSIQNIEIIAESIMASIQELGMDHESVAMTKISVDRSLAAAESAGKDYFLSINRERSRWIALTPDVFYVIDNIGLDVAQTIQKPDGTFILGPELAQIEYGLQTGEFAGYVCAMELKDEEAGRVAMQMEKRTEIPVCWVKTEPGPSDTVSSVTAYNLAALAAAISFTLPDKRIQGEPHTFTNIIWGVIVAGLFVWVIALNKKVHDYSRMPAPIFTRDADKKRKKKK